MNVVYTGQFTNFYEHPLSQEAQACVEGEVVMVDRHFTAIGSRPRYARVLMVVDYISGRRVVFQEDRDA